MAEHEASRDEQRDDDGLALRAYYDDSLMTDQDCTMDDAVFFLCFMIMIFFRSTDIGASAVSVHFLFRKGQGRKEDFGWKLPPNVHFQTKLFYY